MKSVRQVSLVVVMLVFMSGWAQTDVQAPEQGVFNLHKFEQLIGKETYTLTRTPSEVTLKSDFKFTDRGSPVPLTATLTMEKDLTPRAFAIKGKISRFSSIEDSVQGRSAGAVTIPPGRKLLRYPGLCAGIRANDAGTLLAFAWQPKDAEDVAAW